MTSGAQARSAPDLGSLTGPERVAVLLLAIGKAKAAQVLRRFDADELKLITRSAADLRPISAADLDVLVEEFAKRFATGVKFVGTAKELEALLGVVMTEDEIAEVKSGEHIASEPVWELLSKLKEDLLRAYLAKEHPQTTALVLSKLDSALAAKVIGAWPVHQRSDLLCRMLAVRPVGDEAMRAVEGVLREELLAAPADTVVDSHTSIANILNQLDKSETEEVLRILAEARPEDAETLKGMLFSFEDLVTLPQAARTMVFDQIPIERVVLALRKLDSDFQAAILSSLASRSRRMVESELQSGSAASAREITEARRLIVDVVLKMAAKGELELRPAADGDEQAA